MLQNIVISYKAIKTGGLLLLFLDYGYSYEHLNCIGILQIMGEHYGINFADKNLIFDLSIKFIHNYFRFKRGSCSLIQIEVLTKP